MSPIPPLLALGVLLLVADGNVLPHQVGDPDVLEKLTPGLEAAMRGTLEFGPWPARPWELRLHPDDASFEAATGAPPARFASWVGDTLHLRPWEKLQRRDLAAILRHECTHRRLQQARLPRWKEEAFCIWAETHVRPPSPAPEEPEPALCTRLDRALEGGTTATQAWAYRWLRAWLDGKPLPPAPVQAPAKLEPWEDIAPSALVTVVWPPERLPKVLEVNGERLVWRRGQTRSYQGAVHFAPPAPISRLEGACRLEGIRGGWRLSWTVAPETWLASATEGELGAGAPFEAKRALAAVLKVWLQGNHHSDGTLCPLTHCAVVRGMPTAEGLLAVRSAPLLKIPAAQARFTGSHGGVPLTSREVWGGPDAPRALPGPPIPEDPWGTWTRHLSPAQVRALKAAVRPGLKPGQLGLRLGHSGPYAMENLRLETGRRFGWTLWPSNSCEATVLPDGSITLQGHGWGHNAGLSLSSAIFRAKHGETAEVILKDAFGNIN